MPIIVFVRQVSYYITGVHLNCQVRYRPSFQPSINCSGLTSRFAGREVGLARGEDIWLARFINLGLMSCIQLKGLSDCRTDNSGTNASHKYVGFKDMHSCNVVLPGGSHLASEKSARARRKHLPVCRSRCGELLTSATDGWTDGRTDGQREGRSEYSAVRNKGQKKVVQRSKKWLVRGLVKFATAVARLVCPDLLG